MTAAKLRAHQQAAQRPANTSAPITVIGPSKRDVTFHLTPFAPGCEHLAINSPKRQFTTFGRRPGQALDGLFKRLEVSPRAVALTPLQNGETAIHPIGKPDSPWAFIWLGLTFTEAREALAALAALPEIRR